MNNSDKALQQFEIWFAKQEARNKEVFPDPNIQKALEIFAKHAFLEGYIQGVKYTVAYNTKGVNV